MYFYIPVLTELKPVWLSVDLEAVYPLSLESSLCSFLIILPNQRWFCPSTPLSWDPTWSPASSSEALSTGKTWTCWSGSGRGLQKWSEEWNTSPIRTGWDIWASSAWRREGSAGTLEQPSSTWRGPTGKLERDFLQGQVVIGQGVMASSWKRVDLG